MIEKPDHDEARAAAEDVVANPKDHSNGAVKGARCYLDALAEKERAEEAATAWIEEAKDVDWRREKAERERDDALAKLEEAGDHIKKLYGELVRSYPNSKVLRPAGRFHDELVGFLAVAEKRKS